ncbi:MAG: LCP family protein [Armatimonadetes bacterium]|nr:LCP family protein [Armatimonadota bacterium]
MTTRQPVRKTTSTRSQRPGKSTSRRRKKPSLFSVVWKLFLVAVFAAVSLAVGVATYWTVKSPSIRQAATAAVTGGLSPDKAFPGRSELNILLLGRDEDRDNKDRVMNTRGRTDTIVLAHLDFAQRQVNLLSIPRDTLVRIPGYSGRHKINAANALGGPELTAQTVENLIDIKPDGYVLVDYKVFQTLIDQAGGVQVNVPKQLDYDDNWGNLHIHLKPGPQHLNGEQALGLVRFRHSNDGRADSDQERIARQQMLLASARHQFTRPAMLLRLPEVFSTLMEQTDTTLTTDQALCLANFARSVGSNMRMEVLPSIPARSALRMDRVRARQLVEEMFIKGQSKEST